MAIDEDRRAERPVLRQNIEAVVPGNTTDILSIVGTALGFTSYGRIPPVVRQVSAAVIASGGRLPSPFTPNSAVIVEEELL
ncbi:MAG: hypothetical protein ACOX87_01280 [Chloroflexota bacterium]|jgi:hypothetical protein